MSTLGYKRRCAEEAAQKAKLEAQREKEAAERKTADAALRVAEANALIAAAERARDNALGRVVGLKQRQLRVRSVPKKKKPSGFS